jgi:fructokinase
MSAAPPLVAGIEAGGTKFVVAVGTGIDDIRERLRIPTTKPKETMDAVVRFLNDCKRKHGPIKAYGIGSFGPVDLDRKSRTYGFITTTPKKGWQHVDMITTLYAHAKLPAGFDTDVNAAAIGEACWGAGVGADPLVYLTIGTGVGGGVIVNGAPLHGLVHPEMGHVHIPVPPVSEALMPACRCPFHKSCLEGYVSGPAIAARWGIKAEKLPPNHPAIEEAAWCLAHGLANIILTLSPKRIILGGGVMKVPGLLERTRSQLLNVLNGYVAAPSILQHIDHYVVSPGLGDNAGIAGALALALQALNQR